MTSGTLVRRVGGPAALALAWVISVAVAEDAARKQPAPTKGTEAAYHVAGRIDATPLQRLQEANPSEHPLAPAVRWARQGLPPIEALTDYSATMVKRERINGKLNEHEYLYAKVRHKPFSVYLYFLSPASLKGQEVIWIQGQNDGKMWAHTTGVKDKVFGTVSLKPDSMLAMQGQRYPLTEIGLMNLVRRLIEVGEQDMNYGECEVKFFPNTKINDRKCTCIQVIHPTPRRNFLFHLARIFVDDEYNVPVRYEAYDWPKEPGGAPELLEEYTYLNLKFNCGFTDADFDIKNPNYRFR